MRKTNIRWFQFGMGKNVQVAASASNIVILMLSFNWEKKSWCFPNFVTVASPVPNYARKKLCQWYHKKLGGIKHFKSDNLSFIESRLKVGQEQSTSLIAQTKEYLDKNFTEETLILFDAPPGTSCPVIEAVKHADYVILVTEPTPFGLHDLKLAVETVKLLGKAFGVVINRYGIGNKAVEEYCDGNQIPIISKIPNHRTVAKLYSEGKLIYKQFPEIEIEFKKIADDVLHRKNMGVI